MSSSRSETMAFIAFAVFWFMAGFLVAMMIFDTVDRYFDSRPDNAIQAGDWVEDVIDGKKGLVLKAWRDGDLKVRWVNKHMADVTFIDPAVENVSVKKIEDPREPQEPERSEEITREVEREVEREMERHLQEFHAK